MLSEKKRRETIQENNLKENAINIAHFAGEYMVIIDTKKRRQLQCYKYHAMTVIFELFKFNFNLKRICDLSFFAFLDINACKTHA